MVAEWTDKDERQYEHIKDQQKKNIKFINANAENLPFENNFFDWVIAIHILEHLPNLPFAINEVSRVLKSSGLFQIVIPCEGSMAYTLARKISAKRIFEKKYKTSYDWYIKSEHVNLPHEIIIELKKKFAIIKETYFPIPISIKFCNLCIALDLKLKA